MTTNVKVEITHLVLGKKVVITREGGFKTEILEPGTTEFVIWDGADATIHEADVEEKTP